MAELKAADLTREKSLFQLWRLSFKFGRSWFNLSIALAVGALLFRYAQLAEGRPELLIAQVRRLLSAGIAFAPSTLGFLIAGFTVFVTVIRIDVFLKMAMKEKSGTGESFLKYNLSPFMVVFVHYVVFLFVCVLGDLMLQPGGLASLALENARTYELLNPHVESVRYWGAGALVIVLGTWMVYLVMLLKSLVFNVYHVTMTAVRSEWPKGSSKSSTGTESPTAEKGTS